MVTATKRTGIGKNAWKVRTTFGLVAVLLLQTVGIIGVTTAQDAATPDASPAASEGPWQTLDLAEIPMNPGSEQADAVEDATVTFNLGNEIDSGDPQVLAFLNEIEIASKVYVPLLALNSENLVADAGADEVQVSEDGTVYSFHIRDGMTYHDGQPVTANDYAYAIKRACSPVVAGNYSNILYAISGCEAWRECRSGRRHRRARSRRR